MDSPYAEGELTPVVGMSAANWMIKNLKPEDDVVLKIDIEGAEYLVLPDLVKKGALNLVDEVYCEWHDRFVPERKNAKAAYMEIFAELGIKYTTIA